MSLTTGQLAEEASVKKDTVLYYEERGLIEEPPRLENGYRQYPREEVRRIRFIKRAQRLDFTLSEIEQLLALEEGGGTAGDILEITREKIEDIDRKIDRLSSLRGRLETLSEACPGEGPTEACSIVSALTTN